MPLPVWPDNVPSKPQRGSYQVSRSHIPPLKTDMENGDTRMRPKFTKRMTDLSMVVRMTSPQLEVFKAWVWEALAQGSSRFTMPLWGSAGCVNKTCRLAEGTWSATPTGGGWLVTIPLSVENY